MIFRMYPTTDFHEINLDWIIREIMKLHHDYDEFKAVNTITNAGAWDITKQYQAWTIVSNNNAGYISLKPVPAGIAITNNEYWGLIADYDILITNLSDRISDLEADNVVNKANIAFMKDGYAGKSENNPGKRKMLFVGDSYSLSDGSWNWPVWHQRIVSNLDLTNSISLEADGAGFVDTASSHNPDYSGLTWGEILQEYFTADDNITDVVVAGGFNDRNADQGTLAAAISSFVTIARSKYKNAKIWISFIGWSTNYTTEDNLIEKTYTYYKYGAIKNGCTFIEPNGCWGYSDEFYDSSHPNEDGQTNIGLMLSAALCGSEFNRLEEKTTSTTLQVGTGSLTIKIYQHGNDLYFNNDSLVQITMTGETIPASGWYKLASLDDVLPLSPTQFAGVIPLRFNATDSEIYFITASAAIENGDLYIYIPAGMATNKLYVGPFRLTGKFWGAKFY